MLTSDRLEAIRREAGADDLDIPPVAIAWTEHEAFAYFASGGTKTPDLTKASPISDDVSALTDACEKLSLQYKEEPPLKGTLRRQALIGSGGTGLVYLAVHEGTNEQLALKRLHKARVARFGSLGAKLAYREKEAYGVFSSPFIVRCFGYFQDTTSLYMVLELAVFDMFQLVEEEGGKEGELPEAWARFYAASSSTM